jgi:hypothetical protein
VHSVPLRWPAVERVRALACLDLHELLTSHRAATWRALTALTQPSGIPRRWRVPCLTCIFHDLRRLATSKKQVKPRSAGLTFASVVGR